MKLTTAFLICAGCFAQFEPPAFEVASVHQNTGTEPQQIQVLPGNLVLRNQPLFFLAQWAYDLTPPQIDAPEWLMSSRFDIVAKAARPADETHQRLMLRALLANRFGVKAHTEGRVMQVYALTLAKGGPKFQESPAEGTFVLERTNRAVLIAHHARMNDLAQGIAAEAGRPIVDETGLKGCYEIHMDISPYLMQAMNAGGGAQVDTMGILFTGLQDILGLKLKARKQSVDVLVIDHAEKTPTEN